MKTRLWSYNSMILRLLKTYQDCIHTCHIELDLTPLHLDCWRIMIRQPRFCDEISLEKESLKSAICHFPTLRNIFVRVGAIFPNQRSFADKKTLRGMVKAGEDTPITIRGIYKDVSSSAVVVVYINFLWIGSLGERP
jgi:hypothetical protein